MSCIGQVIFKEKWWWWWWRRRQLDSQLMLRSLPCEASRRPSEDSSLNPRLLLPPSAADARTPRLKHSHDRSVTLSSRWQLLFCTL